MAIGGMKQYDAAQVTVIVANVPLDSGFADGEFLTIEQDVADYEDVVGTDGELARSRTNNRAATVMVKLMATSDGNSLLTAVSNGGLLAKNGADVGSLLVRDRLSGVRLYAAAHCWIAKPPNVSFDNKVKMVEWTLRVADLVRVDAGS